MSDQLGQQFEFDRCELDGFVGDLHRLPSEVDLQESIGPVYRHRRESPIRSDYERHERDAYDQPAILDNDAEQIAEIEFFLFDVRRGIEKGSVVHDGTHVRTVVVRLELLGNTVCNPDNGDRGQ